MRTVSPSRLKSIASWLLVLMLGGCGGASWKAPLESRTADSRGGAPQADRPAIRSSRYTVRRGDTLYAIAWRAGLDFRRLARWNGIKPPYVIYPGQVLRLSSPSRTTARSAAQRATRSPAKATRNKAAATPTKPRKAPAAPAGAGKTLRWRWPADGPLLARYSGSDPARRGIKIGGRQGQPVRAAEAGRVVYSGSGLIGYGRLVIIKHNATYLSAYGHNARLLVEEGEQVARGRQIAAMGRANDGKPMLHFEIRRQGKPVNPLGLLPRKK